MPDIAMCSGDRCPQKSVCYRHRAIPEERQSYFGTPPMADDGTCTYFLPLRRGDLLKKKET